MKDKDWWTIWKYTIGSFSDAAATPASATKDAVVIGTTTVSSVGGDLIIFANCKIHQGVTSNLLYKNNITKSRKRLKTNGTIDFIHGSKSFLSDSLFNHNPKVGDMILFPGEMKHAVYPFKSDVERITLSFNIADFGWIHKETLESKPYKMWCNTYD